MLKDLTFTADALLDLLPDTVVVVDAHGRFLYTSAGIEALIGYTSAELHGTYMIELVHPEDRGRTLQTSWQVMSGEPAVGFRNRSLHKDGRIAVVRTQGNADCHLILRGGERPNYDAPSIAAANAALAAAGLRSGVMVDCSHANARKQHERQLVVAEDLARQVETGLRAALEGEDHLLVPRAVQQHFARLRREPPERRLDRHLLDAAVQAFLMGDGPHLARIRRGGRPEQFHRGTPFIDLREKLLRGGRGAILKSICAHRDRVAAA